MAFGLPLRLLSKRHWRKRNLPTPQSLSRSLSITFRGKPITRDKVFRYTNGRFLINEYKACQRRYVEFDLEKLCEVAAAAIGGKTFVNRIEKMEGGFSKALLLKMEDGQEVIAKVPTAFAGPPKYTTAAEVAAMQYDNALSSYFKYLKMYTQVPVPEVFDWSSDSSNPVGAEYIIMGKAPGAQLFSKWGEMTEYQRYLVVKSLTKLEAELTEIHFPVNGSLYLRQSMSLGDKFQILGPDLDPDQRFCIGPSCDRGWFHQGDELIQSHRIDRGPWKSLSSFGTALIEREIARIEQGPRNTFHGPLLESSDDKIAALRKARDIMPMLDSQRMLNKVSQPTLWHTDLHMGNIYVSKEDPAKIVCIIDWQHLVISPLFLQARFPAFLSIDKDFELDQEFPKLPDNYDQIDPEDKMIEDSKLEKAKLAKGYELATGANNTSAYKALFIPSFFSELFVRCGEASEEGVTPLNECLIEISKAWTELEFTCDCPFHFDSHALSEHNAKFGKYSRYHNIRQIAQKLLDTDSEGWIAPQLDFSTRQRENKLCFDYAVKHSSDYGMTPEEIRKAWPFPCDEKD